MSIKPKLNTFDLSMIVVSLVIGIGIFRTPAIVAQKAQTPEIFFAAWIAGALVSICGGLTFAEIGSRYPVAGGLYKVLSHCFRPEFAFMVNWIILLINIASCAGVAIIGAEYMEPLIMPDTLKADAGIKILAIAMISSLFILNFLGIKMGARTQNILSIIKIIMILVFSLAIFGTAHPSTLSPSVSPSDSSRSYSDLFLVFGVALISVLFTYGGYHQTINFGADLKEASKNIAKAILIGVGIVAILYLSINFAYYKVLGFEGMQKSKLIASELANSFFGETGAKITSVVIFISVMGFLNTSMMSIPRLMHAMAEDRVFPPVFSRVNDKTQVQEFALIAFCVCMVMAIFVLGSFEKIMNYVMFNDSISLACVALSIFILRKKENKLLPHTGFKMRWFPVAPVIFILSVLLVTFSVVNSDYEASLYGFALLIAGYPLYLLIKKIIR